MIATEREGAVLTASLDNPPRQFLDRRLVTELDDLTRAVERDRSVRALVITGAHPRSFITHYNVAEILGGAVTTPDVPPAVLGGVMRAIGALDRIPAARGPLSRGPVAGLHTLLRVHQAYLRMNRMDKVVVAAINGDAMAGGCELALACDVRLMADGDFTIGLTEPVLGFNPGGGGGQRLTRAVGPARAVEMLLESHHYTPHEAVELGLVHRVVAPERLLEEAQATAARLARRSPRSVRAVKHAVYRGFSSRWPRGLALDRTGFVWSALSPEVKRAMRVFLEQLETMPLDTPSPWSDPEIRRAWQEGAVTDFGGGVAPAPSAAPAPGQPA